MIADSADLRQRSDVCDRRNAPHLGASSGLELIFPPLASLILRGGRGSPEINQLFPEEASSRKALVSWLLVSTQILLPSPDPVDVPMIILLLSEEGIFWASIFQDSLCQAHVPWVWHSGELSIPHRPVVQGSFPKMQWIP